MITDIDRPMTDGAAAVRAERTHHPERASGWWGIAFGVLFVAGLLLVASTPDYAVGDAEFEHWFTSGGHRARQLVGVVAFVLGALCFVPFAAAVSHWARAASDHPASSVDAALGALFAALVVVGAIVGGHASIAVEIGDTPVPGADVIRSTEQIGYGLILFAAGLVAALLIGRWTVAGRRLGSWPAHLVVVGAVATVALVFGALFIPVLLLPIWAVTAGVTLLAS